MTDHTPAYIAKRLIDCRELAAAEWTEKPLVAECIREGSCDGDSSITRHFPAYDAGHAAWERVALVLVPTMR